MKNTISTLAFAAITTCMAWAQAPGTLDANFGNAGFLNLDLNSKDQIGSAVAVQPDGKILVGGMHEHTANKLDWVIYRLNSDGTADNTFDNDGRYSTSFGEEDYLTDILVQPDGKIVICGYSDGGINNYDMYIHRLNADGSPDNTFGNYGTVQLDRSFGAGDAAVRVKMGPGGKIYVGGYMVISNDVYFLVHRLNPNGTPDSTFGQDGDTFVDMNTQGLVTDMDVAADGTVLLAGYVEQNGDANMAMVKIKPNGLLDDSFAGDGVRIFTTGLNVETAVYGVSLLPDGKVLGVGVRINNGVDALMFRLDANGLFDNTFQTAGSAYYDLSIGGSDAFGRVMRLANGKFLVLGFAAANNGYTTVLAQFTADGDLDINNYGNGSGRLELNATTGADWFPGLAVGNAKAYTAGYSMVGQNLDIVVSASNLYNPVSIQEHLLTINSMKIFPNPATASSEISLLLDDEVSGHVNLEIYASTGEQVYSEAFYKASPNYHHILKFANLARGVYVLHITNAQRTGTQKLIIQ